MGISRKAEREILRTEHIEGLIEYYMNKGEDVQIVKSNEIAFPKVGCEGSEEWVVVTVKIPTGANKGAEPYDGYELAEDYEMKLREKERKKKEKEEEKKRKIAKDEAIRQKKKEIAEKGEQ